MSHIDEFQNWLNCRLQDLHIDEQVFGSYIIGILEGEENPEEKHEALKDVLNGVTTDNIDDVVDSILREWDGIPAMGNANAITRQAEAIETQLFKLMDVERFKTAVLPEKHYTEEEQRIRDQILAQYSQLAIDGDNSETDDVKEDNNKFITDLDIECNTNVVDALAAQKAQRQEARNQAAAKKQKDKEDRERQKKLREEKKEKRKTVKGERRR